MKIKVHVGAEIEPDLISRAIMHRLGVSYSHIFVEHSGLIHHSVGQGMLNEPIENYLKNHTIIATKEVELLVSEDYFNGFMEGASCKDYSESQYVGFLFPDLQKYVGDGRSELICSEFVAWVLQVMAGFNWPEDLDFLDPKEVFEEI